MVVDSGQLSLFASGYWGHPAYQLPPEMNLLAVAHYLEALVWQKDFIRIHAALGGKNPHPQTFLVGGMTTAMDPNEPFAVINPERITFLRDLVKTARKFVEQVYIPDVLAIAPFYKDWFSRGEGLGNFLSYGDYSAGNGMIRIRSCSRAASCWAAISPRSTRWIRPRSPNPSATPGTNIRAATPTACIRPKARPTRNTPGPKPPYGFLDVDKKYSWLKTPRYDGKPMEVGPLARMVVGYAAGQKDINAAVDGVLKKLNAPASVLFSTLGRIAARALESQIMATHSRLGSISWTTIWRTARSRSSIRCAGIPATWPEG